MALFLNSNLFLSFIFPVNDAPQHIKVSSAPFLYPRVILWIGMVKNSGLNM